MTDTELRALAEIALIASKDVDDYAEILEQSMAARRQLKEILVSYSSLSKELGAYREAALYDACMDGPKFKGWNRSQLDRARRMTEEAHASRQSGG